NLRCLEHVVNLGVVDIMTEITKIAVVENKTAIWEYDPALPDNRVLGGKLDVIAAIRTLAVKVYITSSRNFFVFSLGYTPRTGSGITTAHSALRTHTTAMWHSQPPSHSPAQQRKVGDSPWYVGSSI
ncbi:hypothetical protein BDN72DRAFT_774500, partial [Pluteus cervinus]